MDDAEKTPRRTQTGQSSSGLTLVIPSLKALQAKKKALLEETPVKKSPRPVKLKPLREVLTGLITKIKRKDDYGFFLKPVDPAQVPGYAEAVPRPMDFGTMTTKVEKGRYRSLEEFSSDFQLVIANAKAFNPPGTIYHSEASRIETWGAEHIAKAAGQVIEYETDWNIEIERDEDINIEGEDEDAAGPSAGPTTPARRSASVSSSVMPPSKRARGAGKKGTVLSETVEPGGHLPGYKDGLGAFPPGSDWAELMVALKLKGKRYRTKKERLRMERGGPPFAADGSLDYTEMEDPFSVLSAFVPEGLHKPQLTPLYAPPIPIPTDSKQSQSQISVPAPVNAIVPEEPPPRYVAPPKPPEPPKNGKPRYRFWTVTRNAPSRAKAKDKDDEDLLQTPAVEPREPHPTDYGAYATLLERLAKESRADARSAYASQDQLFEAIRKSIESKSVPQPADDGDGTEYWTRRRALEGQEYLREVIYGGVDGLAYVRSLAEFVTPPRELANLPAEDVTFPLGKPLHAYVNDTLVDALTEGRHRLASAAAVHTQDPSRTAPTALAPALQTATAVLPAAARVGAQMRALGTQPLDLASLIHVPEELFAADAATAGAKGVALAQIDTDPAVLARAMEHASALLAQLEARHQEVRMETDKEDPLETQLRMTLIALAKRAPLDQIGRMPPELVPAHLRGFVPTIGF